MPNDENGRKVHVIGYYTLQLHNNTVLYNAHSVITRSHIWLPIFFKYIMYKNVSRQSRYTQCKLWKS